MRVISDWLVKVKEFKAARPQYRKGTTTFSINDQGNLVVQHDRHSQAIYIPRVVARNLRDWLNTLEDL